MNQTQAISALKKIIGPKFGYRMDPKAPDAEARAQLLEDHIAATAAIATAKEEMRARREAILALDADYQRLKAAYQTAVAVGESIPSQYRHRVTVGRATGLFFSVVAEGDNWAEVVEKVTPKAVA